MSSFLKIYKERKIIRIVQEFLSITNGDYPVNV